jgi:hypothetical protein
MAIERPTIEQLQELASRLHMRLTPAQAEEYLALMQANFDAYDLIDALPDEIPAARYPRAAAIALTAKKIRSMPGITRAKCKVQRPASWPAAPWRLRTTSRWPACQ